MKLVGSKKAVRSLEFHKKRELQRRVRLGAIAILILTFVIAPIFIFRNDGLLISSVSVAGNEVTEVANIQKLAEEKLLGSYLKLIPKASAIFYPKKNIEKSLLDSIPRLASVNVSLSGLKSIEVEVSEREPVALYCLEVGDIDNPSKCFFLDDEGYVYSEAPIFSGGIYSVYTSQPKLEDPIRSNFLTKEDLSTLELFLKNLKTLNLEPKVLMRKGDEYTLYLEMGMELRWRTNQNLESLYLDLTSFFKESKLKSSDISQLLYIDLRFDNKIFYKFVGE